MSKSGDGHGRSERLVHDAEHGDDLAVLRLVDKLGEDANDVERPLRVRKSHDAGEEVDGSVLARVVIAILRSRNRMKVEVDPETVLARPGDRLEEIFKIPRSAQLCARRVRRRTLPADVRKERLALEDLDHPEADRDANPVESGGSDLGKVLLGL